jgi:predicted N-acyltransferase
MSFPRFLDSLQSIAATDWDALHDGRNPFVSHAFLSGLEQHGCLREDWGWQPRHFTLWEGGTLGRRHSRLPETNSHGEFVFDHAWANAYARHGRDYYPKWWLGTRRSPARACWPVTIQGAPRCCRHCARRCQRWTCPRPISTSTPQWTRRCSAMTGCCAKTQFQWQNPGDWTTFDQFLGAMNHKHRKNIRQERAKVTRQGITFRVVHGDEASRADLQAMYRSTCRPSSSTATPRR